MSLFQGLPAETPPVIASFRLTRPEGESCQSCGCTLRPNNEFILFWTFDDGTESPEVAATVVCTMCFERVRADSPDRRDAFVNHDVV